MTEKQTKEISTLNISIKESDVSVQALSIKSILLIQEFIKILENNLKETNPIIRALLSYSWSFEAKNLSLLLRDGILNLLKIERYVKDNRREVKDLTEYKKELLDTIQSASIELIQSFEKVYNAGGIIQPGWKHETNPSSFIISQMNDISDQIKIIQRSERKLDKLSNSFADYRSSFKANMKQRVARVEHIKFVLDKLKEEISLLKEPIDEKELKYFLKIIKSSIDDIENQPNQAPYEFIVLEDAEKLKIPVETNQGKLIFKSIDILSEISGWSSFKLLSPLKSIDTKLKVFKERVLINLLQQTNRVNTMLGPDVNQKILNVKKSELGGSINRALSEYKNELEPQCLHNIEDIQKDLDHYIVPSQLFDKNHNFLPTSALGQIAGFSEKSELERRYNPTRIKSSIAGYADRIFSRYSTQEQLTAAGYINYLLNFETESDANSLFLKKGFLGNSFTVDRADLLLKLDRHFQLWKLEYGGGLLISGNHLTGKSTILEMIPVLYTETISHHLVPGQKIDVNGSKLQMTTDLIYNLEFIIKNKGPERCIVTIDDLDLYSDSLEQTFELFDYLSTIISKYSKQIYVVVSMHKTLEKRLSHFFDLNLIFSEKIYTNYTPTELIERAVLTRAHAVTTSEKSIKETEAFVSLARKVSKKANGNIGKAMQLWSMYKGGYYKGESGSLGFKSLVLNNQHLLQTLISHKQIQELNLLESLNAVDGVNLKTKIEGLVQLFLLERPKEGFIGINPYLITFIESILEKQNNG